MPGPENRPPLAAWLLRAAERHAAAVAVTDGGRELTVGQLKEQACALAAALLAAGLSPGDRVALRMEKSPASITAIYATLLAGAVCVPVGRDWPAARMEQALADCTPRFLIEDGTDSNPDPRIVSYGAAAEVSWTRCVGRQGMPPPAVRTGPNDPALILFTSGSTGRPKGVVHSQRSVSAFVDWTASEFEIGLADRLACPAPLGFDLSTFDVFNIARSAATCVVVPANVTWLPRHLVDFLKRRDVTVLYIVPSILQGMLAHGRWEQTKLPALRLLLSAGEVLLTGVAARVREIQPHTTLCNLYGPTETNVVSWHRTGHSIESGRPIPIGRPCPYASLSIDPASRELDHGIERGELLAGGESLMLGYWNRPDETQRALAGHADVSGRRERCYRTGDWVARDSTGTLTFLGRTDRQVKRRGIRIELDEIETVVRNWEHAADAAVVATSPAEGQVIITAFVGSPDLRTGLEMDLRAHCGASLPPHLLPDRFRLVDTIPRGERGKIDYHALGILAMDDA